MKFNTLPRIFLEEYDIPNPPVPSLLVLNIAMSLFCSVLVVTMLPRNDNVTLILLVLQLRLRIGPIQRMGANVR
jgi:hypothetical protein